LRYEQFGADSRGPRARLVIDAVILGEKAEAQIGSWR
jgi:hypothetical protein|tara:strand:- start:15763 stop:15873 length:111 start_codon:yes stop_codon:yes gene_type:complete